MKQMKTILCTLLVAACSMTARADEFIKVQTRNTDLILKVKGNGRVQQAYMGPTLTDEKDLHWLGDGPEAYAARGSERFMEAALDIEHADGNPSTQLTYIGHTVQPYATRDGSEAMETIITLEDKEEPLTVTLHYVAYKDYDIIQMYTEIQNRQKKPVTLRKFDSAQLHFYRHRYYLTQFDGEWAREAKMTTSQLSYGKKVVDSKLGSRANMFAQSQFILSLDNPATETAGDCLLGQIGWSGNFHYTMEVDERGRLHVMAGINPYGSHYTLDAGKTFRTADFYFTYSTAGLERASQNLHNWARRQQVLNGMGDRMTLLNNWEATYFDFNQEKLIGLMGDAVRLGVDMFLLDDGWFANKYPRSSDRSGLGDWEETRDKLPGGIKALCDAAREKGVKFGLWIEPEMVNPKSELFEKHRDWVLLLPNREMQTFRQQLVLDLTNPKVQDFVYGVVDRLLTSYPEIAYFKWDCNSPIMNIYSPYLKDRQENLYVDYVRGLYNVLERLRQKYPTLPIMLCSGGSGRVDYKALQYFTEFWASDNTDPVERLFIQYGYSFFYPTRTVCAHVTTWNRSASVKFRTDVASMGKLGFDIKLSDMNENEITYARAAVENYNRLKPVILDGDLFRLVSPYEGNHASSLYVAPDKQHAVLFTFDIYPRFDELRHNVVLRGLDPNRRYRLQEINLMPGKSSWVNGRTYSGAYLMNIGLDLFTTGKLNSRVVELVAE